MYGWAGAVLWVDLTAGKISKRPLERQLAEDYLGGRGINSRLLFQLVQPGTDGLSPENVLIFGNGPVVGTIAPSCCKLTVSAMSPLTGILGDANVGGEFPPVLRWAGYDHIVVTGRAPEPVYLWIDDDRVALRPARHLWGKDTWQTLRAIREELGDPTLEVLSIGQAGENLVRFACIISKLHRAAGRTGMGAVMGSKNLKAVAVRGSGSVRVARPREFVEHVRELTRRIQHNPFYSTFSTYGTSSLMQATSLSGTMVVRNWQQSGEFRGIDQVNHEVLARDYYTKSVACFACPMHCSHHFEVKEGPFAGEKGGGMEYGAGGYFGPLFDNPYTPSLFKCLNLLNQYGMDSMDTAAALAAAFEWYEQGLIGPADTDGLELRWGNYEAIIELLHRVARRQGLGHLLAEGPLNAAKEIGRGAEKVLSHAKGLCWAGDDYRVMKGSALAAATSTRGGDLERGLPAAEYFGMSPEESLRRYGTESASLPTSYDKAGIVYLCEAVATAADCLQVCKFNTEYFNQEMGLQEMATLFSLATGVELDREGLIQAADRVYNVERAFLVREGITRADDHLKGRWGEEPVPSGPYQGERIDPEKFEGMLDEYYRLRGWDPATGIPTRATLERLGLKEVADQLEAMGKGAR
ncbi:MAG: aldehyde ferredoxin oxidoreductase family protein [Candidatus Tectomicrobia bacterium]|uniref:Aldehyde ferredoxin oxidoreductase family protein n=1 Tax=Tectimicrobiota bacterium TaxID=2528274 RepID=A0A932CR06_UNCTE|nr:aldehyde ferredoxin oxidoreductase family protein [Candidatus Tectomicrobia bacterium]